MLGFLLRQSALFSLEGKTWNKQILDKILVIQGLSIHSLINSSLSCNPFPPAFVWFQRNTLVSTQKAWSEDLEQIQGVHRDQEVSGSLSKMWHRPIPEGVVGSEGISRRSWKIQGFAGLRFSKRRLTGGLAFWAVVKGGKGQRSEVTQLRVDSWPQLALSPTLL